MSHVGVLGKALWAERARSEEVMPRELQGTGRWCGWSWGKKARSRGEAERERKRGAAQYGAS